MVEDALDHAAVDVEFAGDGTLAVPRPVPGAEGLLQGWRNRQVQWCILRQRWRGLVPKFGLGMIQQRVLREAGDEELPEITAIRHRAAMIRRILTPGRDLAARTPLLQSLPGATSETQLYAEDINDELHQVVADFTAIEERCSALLGLHAALASKHVASVSRRLADVATISSPSPSLLASGDKTSTCSPAASKRDGRRSWSSAWTERGLRCGDRLYAQPSQLEVMRMPSTAGGTP